MGKRLLGGHSKVAPEEKDFTQQRGFFAVLSKLFRRSLGKKTLRKDLCKSIDNGLGSSNCQNNTDIKQRSLSLNNIEELNRNKSEKTWLYISDVILTNDDKWEVLSGRCLSDDIIHAAQLLLKKQFPHVNGLQDPTHTPIKAGTTLVCPLKFHQVRAPCAQIHHNGRNHWVTSIKDSPHSDIHLLDSAYYIDPITPSLEIQLSQIYRENGNSRLTVEIPNVPQQKNRYDCGVYAIAFLTEYCFKKYRGGSIINFKEEEMRPHLVKCLSRGKMSPFPR